MFFFKDNKKAKARRRLKKRLKKKKAEMMRRTHIILEARKKHMKNKKDSDKTLSKGGFSSVSNMEDDDLGVKIAAGVNKGIQMSGNAMARLKKRQKSLNKSRSTHLAKLQSARNKVQARSRT